MTNQWHYAKQGQRIGPVSEEYFKSLALSGEIQPTDMVWTEGMATWVPANKIQSLSFVSTYDNASHSTTSEEWYYAKGDQKFGPVSSITIKNMATSGQLSPNDLVWKETMSQWTEAKNIEGLFPYVNPRLSPPLPTNPTTQSSYIQNQGDQSLIHPSNSPHNPVLMGILSGLCIAGLGQVILGQKIKGLVILLGSMVLAVLTGGISIFVTWPAGGIDAYLIAKKLKEGKSVGQWEFF